MEYFTIMILTYTLAGEPFQSKILYTSYKRCGDALVSVHDTIYEMDRGAMAQCEITDIPSKSIRPKARPTK